MGVPKDGAELEEGALEIGMGQCAGLRLFLSLSVRFAGCSRKSPPSLSSISLLCIWWSLLCARIIVESSTDFQHLTCITCQYV